MHIERGDEACYICKPRPVSRDRDRFGKQPLFGHCDIRNKDATTINVPMSAPVIPMTFYFCRKGRDTSDKTKA